MQQRRLIGIVGGLGPFAHLDFKRKLLEAASELVETDSGPEPPGHLLFVALRVVQLNTAAKQTSGLIKCTVDLVAEQDTVSVLAKGRDM